MRPTPLPRAVLLAATVLAAIGLAMTQAAHAAPPLPATPIASGPAATATPFATPTEYNFAPPPSIALPPDPVVPAPPLPATPLPSAGGGAGVHGVVSSTVGNRGEGGAVALESALPGTNGRTHVFLQADGGQDTPWKHGPTVTGHDVSGGFSTILPDDAGSLTVMLGTAQTSWSRR